MFSHFSISQLVVKLKARDTIHLSAFKGSTLRGGFGYALKQVSCALKKLDCKKCLLRERCVFLYLFETPPPQDAEMMRLYPAAPHPFVIEPPEIDLRTIPEGGEFEFGLTLVGRALEFLPYFIYAFLNLGEMGLGRGRGKFSLDDVRARSPGGFVSIFHNKDGSLIKPGPWPTWEAISTESGALYDSGRIHIQFQTPTRIKSGGSLNDKPEFHHIMRSLLRRLSALSYFHCGRRLDIDFRGLIARAQGVRCKISDLRWEDWERYSSRQKQKMTLGGFVGEAEFEGDLGEFLPILKMGSVLHVGKAAGFGFGRYSLALNGRNIP